MPAVECRDINDPTLGPSDRPILSRPFIPPARENQSAESLLLSGTMTILSVTNHSPFPNDNTRRIAKLIDEQLLSPPIAPRLSTSFPMSSHLAQGGVPTAACTDQ